MTTPPDPIVGAYERLISRSLAARLATLDGRARREDLDPAEASRRLAGVVEQALVAAFEGIPKSRRTTAQVELANQVLDWLANQDGSAADPIQVPGQVLRAIDPPAGWSNQPAELPSIPLLDHDLLANSPDEPRFVNALLSEFATADRIDAVVAFIRRTGLNLIRNGVKDARDRGVPIRVLTTTYTGSTQRAAIDWLADNGVEVQVSYDTRTTRLHAKSWIIHRDTGFSTAYVGSSNLSHSALVEGLEWNVRLAQAAAPDVFDKLTATFESLWNDDTFEAYDPQRDGERFTQAIDAGRSGTPITGVSGLEIRPWSYQREMLEAVVTERLRFDRHRNLVVAPTGTGKTVFAALDYRALLEGDGGNELPRDPTLLFVAHREKILSQSLQTFRDVLKRGDFGELFVGGQRPKAWRHVFASIQSLNARDVEELDPGHFDVVYVDEFHHASAPTYERLLNHLQPREVVGLTATPERADGINVKELFDDRYAFEMRLWDALDQQLLVPFHYYGVADGTDLSSLEWKRGGYRTSDLENVYFLDENEQRTSKVLAALHDTVDVASMRAFGFCVSVAHATYMAERFRQAGIAAEAMSGETPRDERERQLHALRSGELSVIFAVDVLTEGVDVPSVDTILLLRPTESATVFLQQIGRGLRLHRDKDVCLVLDFIGQQHRRFRSDLRLRALTGRSKGELVDDLEHGFPRLPAGCHLQLDAVAEELVRANLEQVISTTTLALSKDLRELTDVVGRELTLRDFLDHAALDLHDLYAKSSWTQVQRLAGYDLAPPGPRETELTKGVRRLLEVDDRERIGVIELLAEGIEIPADARAQRLASMVAFPLFDDGKAPDTLEGVAAALSREPAIVQELRELAVELDARADHITRPSPLPAEVPLHVHGTYRREEVLVALGDRALGDRISHREGVKYIRPYNIDVFMVTLEKSERDYSPTTRYHDYAISRDLFHWESQSNQTRTSPTGQRYLDGSSTVLLFVRRTNKVGGRAPAYTFLGPVSHVSDKGEKPIQITWKLQTPMPETLFRTAKAAGG
nr:DUF3427 domain-containing protein [Salsipaludibacter albus]